MTTATPQAVADAAVATGVLPLNRLTVIGLFDTADGPAALLRTSAGDIARVTVGDKINGGTIAGINETGLVLSGPDGSIDLLEMPKG